MSLVYRNEVLRRLDGLTIPDGRLVWGDELAKIGDPPEQVGAMIIPAAAPTFKASQAVAIIATTEAMLAVAHASRSTNG